MTTEVVNIVASTQLCERIDLNSVADGLGINYEQEQFPGMVYKILKPKVCILFFRSGKAVVTGARNEEAVEEAFSILHKDLVKHDFEVWDFDPDAITLQNIVITYNYGAELNLNELIFSLPFEHTEYEPEQFPGLIFRLPEPKTVCLIFSSGKCVITGSRSIPEAMLSSEILKESLDTAIAKAPL